MSPLISGRLPNLPDNSSGFLPCKRIQIQGLPPKFLGRATGPTYPIAWCEKLTVAQYKNLKDIDIDLCIDEEQTHRFFPPPPKDHDVPKLPQFRSLFLLYAGFDFKPHMFGYLRGLRKLEVFFHPTLDNVADWPAHRRRICTSNLWKQLSREKIYLEEISLAVPVVEDMFLDYIISYPQPILEKLWLHAEYTAIPTEQDDHGLPAIPGRFFREVLPVIAPSLQCLDVSTSTPALNDWCLGQVPEASANFKRCTKLAKVTLPVNTDPANAPANHVVFSFFSDFG